MLPLACYQFPWQSYICAVKSVFQGDVCVILNVQMYKLPNFCSTQIYNCLYIFCNVHMCCTILHKRTIFYTYKNEHIA